MAEAEEAGSVSVCGCVCVYMGVVACTSETQSSSARNLRNSRNSRNCRLETHTCNTHTHAHIHFIQVHQLSTALDANRELWMHTLASLITGKVWPLSS